MAQNEEMVPVFSQIINVLQDLEANEEIVLNASDEPFFTSDENFMEFNLAGKYLIAKVEEI